MLDNATDNHGQRIDALFVREDHPITLVFKDGELSVNNTCNRMGAGYTLEGSTLSIAPMISTQMACPETGVMVQEAAIGSGLEGILTIRWLDASRLELVTLAGNVLRFRSAPLADDLAEGSMPINLEHAHAD
nr:META domain-containing protein [Stenotrophomonas maltophilia]